MNEVPRTLKDLIAIASETTALYKVEIEKAKKGTSNFSLLELTGEILRLISAMRQLTKELERGIVVETTQVEMGRIWTDVTAFQNDLSLPQPERTFETQSAMWSLSSTMAVEADFVERLNQYKGCITELEKLLDEVVVIQ